MRLRRQPQPEERPLPELVEATKDLQFGSRWIPKGTRLPLSDPVLREGGHIYFQHPAQPATAEEVNDA